MTAKPKRHEFLLPRDFGIRSFSQWDLDTTIPLTAADILPPPPAKPPRPVAYLVAWHQWHERSVWSTFRGRRALKMVGGEYLRYCVGAVYPDGTSDRFFTSADPRAALAELYRLGALHNLPVKDGGAVAITSALVRIAELLGTEQTA